MGERRYENVRVVPCTTILEKFTYTNAHVMCTIVREDGSSRPLKWGIKREYDTGEIQFKSLIEDVYPEIHNM